MSGFWCCFLEPWLLERYLASNKEIEIPTTHIARIEKQIRNSDFYLNQFLIGISLAGWGYLCFGSTDSLSEPWRNRILGIKLLFLLEVSNPQKSCPILICINMQKAEFSLECAGKVQFKYCLSIAIERIEAQVNSEPIGFGFRKGCPFRFVLLLSLGFVFWVLENYPNKFL